MHGNIVFKQVLERSDGVLGFFKTKFYFEQKKVDQKLAKGMRNSFLEKVSHNSALGNLFIIKGDM